MLNPTILTSGDETCTVLVDGAQVRVRYSYPSRVHNGAGDVIHTGESHADALAYAEAQILPEVRGDGFRDVTDDPLSAESLAAIFSSEYRPRVDPDGAVYYGAGVPLCMGVVGEGVDGARGRTFEDLRLITAAELPPFPLHGPPLPDIAPDLLRVATALVALALASSVTARPVEGAASPADADTGSPRVIEWVDYNFAMGDARQGKTSAPVTPLLDLIRAYGDARSAHDEQRAAGYLREIDRRLRRHPDLA